MIKKIIILTILIRFLNTSVVAQQIELSQQDNVNNENYLVEIPFVYNEGHIFIDVIINKKKYLFLFDTGCSGSIIDKNILREIKFENLGKLNVEGPSFPSQRVKAIKIASMNIGAISFDNIESIVQDIDYLKKWHGCLKIDGVIGLNVMLKTNLQIDYKDKVIRIAKNFNQLQVSDRSYVVKMSRSEQKNIYVNLFINDMECEFIVDTGSNTKFTPSQKIVQLLIAKDTTTQFIINKKSCAVYAKKIKLGDMLLKNKILISEIGVPSLLGNAFFENYIVTFNWDSNTLILDPITEAKDDYINTYECYLIPNYLNNKIEIMNGWKNYMLPIDVPDGSHVVKINNIDVSHFNDQQLCDFWNDFKTKISYEKKIEIEINLKKEIKKIVISKKQLLPTPESKGN